MTKKSKFSLPKVVPLEDYAASKIDLWIPTGLDPLDMIVNPAGGGIPAGRITVIYGEESSGKSSSSSAATMTTTRRRMISMTTNNDPLLMSDDTNREVCRLLMSVVGETGENEGAVDVVKRLIDESRSYYIFKNVLEDALKQEIDKHHCRAELRREEAEPEAPIDEHDGCNTEAGNPITSESKITVVGLESSSFQCNVVYERRCVDLTGMLKVTMHNIPLRELGAALQQAAESAEKVIT